MEPETYNQEAVQVEQKSSLYQVTPLSKYLALALFVILPFLGGWIGYMYAPEKAVEVERVVVKEVVVEKEIAVDSDLAIVNAAEVERVVWLTEKRNSHITDPNDFTQYEETVLIDVFFSGGTIQRFELGTAYGCDGQSSNEKVSQDDGVLLGELNCYMSLVGTDFTAFLREGDLVVERYDDDASGRTEGERRVVLWL